MLKLVAFLILACTSQQTQSVRQRQYLSLAEATLQNPITPDELRGALLSPQGVAGIRVLFERSVAESLELEGGLVTPELGGEATLDRGVLVFVAYPDPVHPPLRGMVRLQTEPERLLAFLEGSAAGEEILLSTGGLQALLYMMSKNAPTDEQKELLPKVVASAVAKHFKTWTVDPETQARMIEAIDWRGRYVGFWHVHPPRFREGTLSVGIEPSFEDMTNASQLGQFLTIVFQPEGFDAYDLSPLARTHVPDLSRARKISYRSPDWESHFQGVVRARLRK